MPLYEVRRLTQFKCDVKLCQKRGKDMDKFKIVHDLLAQGKALPPRYRDHLLTGNWRGFRECHLEPDWLLVYRISLEDAMLEYARMGTHSDLF